MIFKITLAIVVGLFALISIPSIVATCMLLAKSIDSYSEKRQRERRLSITARITACLALGPLPVPSACSTTIDVTRSGCFSPHLWLTHFPRGRLLAAKRRLFPFHPTAVNESP